MPVNSFDDYPMSWKPKKELLTAPKYRALAAVSYTHLLPVWVTGKHSFRHVPLKIKASSWVSTAAAKTAPSLTAATVCSSLPQGKS